MTAPDAAVRTYVADAAYSFHDGTARRLPRAVVVQGNRVVRLLDPDRRHVRAEIARTEQHDLTGCVLIPGLIDAHNHQPTAARDVLEVRTATARSLSQLRDLLAEAALRTPVGEWITTEHSLTLSQLGGGALPVAGDFDPVTPDHPVAVRFGAHTMVLNSVALERIGVAAGVADPPGGVIDRAAPTGEPLGPIREYGATRLVLEQLTPPTDERLVGALRAVQREYAAAGLTSVRVPGLRPADLGLYQELLRTDGRLANRMFGGPRLDPVATQEEKLATIDDWPSPAGFAGGGWIGLHAVKIFVDGGIETALDGRTHLFLDRSELVGLFRAAAARGWPVACHAVTPTAIGLVLEAYEQAGRVDEAPPALTIEHGYLATADQLARIGRLGIWLSAQPAIADLESTLIHRSLGEAEATASFPLASALRREVPCVLGSDWNATPGSSTRPFDPLRSIRAATDRIGADGRHLGSAEQISVETAFYLHTKAPALMIGRSDLGLLWPGACADVVVLDADPLTDLDQVAVAASIVDGVAVDPSPALG